MKLLLTILALFHLTSCSHLTLKKEKIDSVCISDENQSTVMNSLVGVYKRFKEKTPDFQLVESSCSKRVYKHQDYIAVIYVQENQIKGKLTTLNGTSLLNFRKSALNCLKDAENLAKSFEVELINNVLIKNKSIKVNPWNDPDIGPASWVKCPHKSGVEFNESVITLIHELNHSNKSKARCIYNPKIDTELCFNFDKLPKLEMAYIHKLPTDIPPAITALNSIQDLYLKAPNNHFINVLDEMVAYSIGSRVQAAFLNKHGKASIFIGDNTRNAQFLSLLMVISANYLKQFKIIFPDKFNKFYSGKNKKNIEEIFKLSEENYHIWEKSLLKIGKKPKQPEHALFMLFKKYKKDF